MNDQQTQHLLELLQIRVEALEEKVAEMVGRHCDPSKKPYLERVIGALQMGAALTVREIAVATLTPKGAIRHVLYSNKNLFAKAPKPDHGPSKWIMKQGESA